jgi:hypothetical protein
MSSFVLIRSRIEAENRSLRRADYDNGVTNRELGEAP